MRTVVPPRRSDQRAAGSRRRSAAAASMSTNSADEARRTAVACGHDSVRPRPCAPRGSSRLALLLGQQQRQAGKAPARWSSATTNGHVGHRLARDEQPTATRWPAPAPPARPRAGRPAAAPAPRPPRRAAIAEQDEREPHRPLDAPASGHLAVGCVRPHSRPASFIDERHQPEGEHRLGPELDAVLRRARPPQADQSLRSSIWRATSP